MQTNQIEQRLRRLEDAEAIRTLKARYFFCCDRKDPKGMRACFADGPVHIDYGVVGIFDNADALVKVYTEIACHGHMVEIHHPASASFKKPMICSSLNRFFMSDFLSRNGLY